MLRKVNGGWMAKFYVWISVFIPLFVFWTVVDITWQTMNGISELRLCLYENEPLMPFGRLVRVSSFVLIIWIKHKLFGAGKHFQFQKTWFECCTGSAECGTNIRQNGSATTKLHTYLKYINQNKKKTVKGEQKKKIEFKSQFPEKWIELNMRECERVWK